jgi:hypothetical protein
MVESILKLERNGFLVRRISPIDPTSGVHAREFRADFAKQTSSGLLVFSIRVDLDGNIAHPNS